MKEYVFSQKVTMREYFKVRANNETEAREKMEQLDYLEHINNADDYIDCGDFQLEDVKEL